MSARLFGPAARRSVPLHQVLAWLYCLLFVGVVVITHLPGLADAQGRNLGLFQIDPIDDVVHGVSALWAAVAAWRSPWASRFYFRAFGLFYTLGAFIGLFTGYTSLDFVTRWSIVPGYAVTGDLATNILANLPHFIIGPLALAIGFLLPYARRHRSSLRR